MEKKTKRYIILQRYNKKMDIDYYTYKRESVKLGFIKTSKTELIEILKAWLMISAAFGIVMGGFSLTQQFLITLVLAAFTAGVGFLLHELAHKLVAQRYGAWAEFRSFDQMLILAVIMSFFGFVFAAPGAVFIHGKIDARKNGIISLAGPMTNLVLSFLFLLAKIFTPFWPVFLNYGFLINGWLGVFNMIPFGNFDGRKIMVWSKPAFYGTLIAGVLLLFAGYLV